MAARKMPNRTPVSCTLPPDKAARLLDESADRVLAPARIIELALDRLWADEDAKHGPPA